MLPAYVDGSALALRTYGVIKVSADEAEVPEDPEHRQFVERRFERIQQMLDRAGVMAGTAHKRLLVPKQYLTENELKKMLGFEPVTIAIPEAGQDRFQSFRHPKHTYHVHSHPEGWTFHQDSHPAATMLMKNVKSVSDKTRALLGGIPHAKDEGLPGLYYYVKGRLGGHKSTAKRVLSELPSSALEHMSKWTPSPGYLMEQLRGDGSEDS